MINTQSRYKELIRCMINDHVSTKENVRDLRNDLYAFSKDMKFKRASTMGQILRTALDFVNAESAEKFVEKGWDEEKQMYYYLVYFNKEEKK